jgi:hypothetical protein
VTPNLAYIHVDNPHWRRFGLWLPLFLLWIPGLILAPFILLIMVVVCLVGGVNPWRAIATFWAILCALPGTNVHVTTGRNQVKVRIL